MKRALHLIFIALLGVAPVLAQQPQRNLYDTVVGNKLTSHKAPAFTRARPKPRGAAGPSQWFAAPNGASNNAGTQASPWDLNTVMGSAAGQIQPGDTVWLLPGSYSAAVSDGFVNHLVGTAAAPIYLRDYNEHFNIAAWLGGARALLDAHGKFSAYYDLGQYTWVWGVEMADSGHVTSTTSTAGLEAFGVYAQGPGARYINDIVHDTTQGFSSYNPASDNEYSGNLSYANGYTGPDRNHGHGMYMQNLNGAKYIFRNRVFDNADEGIQIYGSGNANLVNITADSNSIANNSSWPIEHYQYNIVLGGGNAIVNCQILNELMWFNPSARYGFTNFGQYSNAADAGLVATGNVLVGGYSTLAIDGIAGPITFTGNKLYNIPPDSTGVPISLIRLNPYATQAVNASGFANNQYYGLNAFELGNYTVDANFNYAESGHNLSFAAWQAAGYDAGSTYADGAPTTNWVYVTPDRYETKRGGITIYNWTNASSVAVDVSGILAPGDPYVVQDVENFFGPAVASGTYQGGTINIPMTGLVRAPVIGLATALQPPHTAPAYGMFEVISANHADVSPLPPYISPAPVPPPNPNPTPAPAGFTANEAIQVKPNAGANLNVRSTADATATPIGSAAPSAIGIINSGPVTGGSFIFYNVTFTTGLEGYVVQDYIVAYTGSLPTPWPPVPNSNPNPPSAAHTIVLTWNTQTDETAGFNVYRSTSSGTGYAKLSSTAHGVATFTDSTGVAGTKYFYVVTAVNATGESGYSNEASATQLPLPTPPPPPPAGSVPNPPTGATAVAN